MEYITELQPGQIFTFGSNEAGIHGAGAALFAKQKFGAIQGRGYGLQGRSFAIPTRHYFHGKLVTLPISEIYAYVVKFLEFAATKADLEFLVTPIGTGYAGYDARQIAPMFVMRTANVKLPVEFLYDMPE